MVFRSTVPAWPVRGLGKHVPMAPEGDAPDGAAPKEEAKAEPKTPEGKATEAKDEPKAPEKPKAEAKTEPKPKAPEGKAAAANGDDQFAEREAALQARIASLEAKLEGHDEITRFMQRDRDNARLQALRKMGLAVPLSDAQVLAISPQVDPRDPDGVAKLDEWRKANERLFSAPTQSLESMVEASRVELGEAAKRGGSLFNADKLIKNMLGG